MPPPQILGRRNSINVGESLAPGRDALAGPWPTAPGRTAETTLPHTCAGFVLTGAFFGSRAFNNFGESLWESNNKGVSGLGLGEGGASGANPPLASLGFALTSRPILLSLTSAALWGPLPLFCGAEALQGHCGRAGGERMSTPLPRLAPDAAMPWL